jgi:hypothetical protein
MEKRNARNALYAPSEFARLVGAPVVHAAISGAAHCRMPELPSVPYRGWFEGGALVAAADGEILALRRGDEGAGVAVAEIDVGRVPPVSPIPRRYWLHRRGLLPAVAWNTQRLHGRRWYRQHVRR